MTTETILIQYQKVSDQTDTFKTLVTKLTYRVKLGIICIVYPILFVDDILFYFLLMLLNVKSTVTNTKN